MFVIKSGHHSNGLFEIMANSDKKSDYFFDDFNFDTTFSIDLTEVEEKYKSSGGMYRNIKLIIFCKDSNLIEVIGEKVVSDVDDGMYTFLIISTKIS